MNSFTIEIFAEFPLVTFYTVKKEKGNKSETDKFVSNFDNNEEFQDDYDEIVGLLKIMGNEECATDMFFSRHEDEASALPPKMVRELKLNYQSNLLRLYCVKINDHIVVLFNGGVKTSQTAQDSPDIQPKFRDAKYFARRIWEEINEDMIIVEESRHLLRPFKDGDELTIQ